MGHLSDPKTFDGFRESIIRRVTTLCHLHKAINLGQGFSAEAPPDEAAEAAACALLVGTSGGCDLVLSDDLKEQTVQNLLSVRRLIGCQTDELNHYSPPFGTTRLRQAVAKYYEKYYEIEVDAEKEVTITLGSTEAFSTVLRSVCEPGDGVLLIQPCHEMYVNQVRLFHFVPWASNMKVQTLENGALTWQLDWVQMEELCEQKENRIRALVLNTPHNPTGVVFDGEDLERLIRFALQHQLLILTDEIYEHFIFGDRFQDCGTDATDWPHVCLWKDPRARQITLIVNSVSKMGCATGWRVGWVLSQPSRTPKIRAIHDTLAMQAPTPLQFAAEKVLALPAEYFRETIPETYKRRYHLLASKLKEVGFEFAVPDGAYYIFAFYDQVKELAHLTENEAVEFLIEKIGVACIPGHAFYAATLNESERRRSLRFAFCRNESCLKEAGKRLLKLKCV